MNRFCKTGCKTHPRELAKPWSGQRESNPHEQLGKLPGYHYIMPAAPDGTLQTAREDRERFSDRAGLRFDPAACPPAAVAHAGLAGRTTTDPITDQLSSNGLEVFGQLRPSHLIRYLTNCNKQRIFCHLSFAMIP